VKVTHYRQTGEANTRCGLLCYSNLLYLQHGSVNSDELVKDPTKATCSKCNPEGYRKEMIRQDVRATIIYYLTEDLEGDELLMKEIWEHCDSDEEVEAAKEELRRAIDVVRRLD
jgi:hypothetical protein